MKWVERWRYEISEKPVRPGVWRRREGGFLVRGRATDPSGKRREVLRALDVANADEARAQLLVLLGAVATPPSAPPRTRFDAYAASLLERKVRDNTIRSAKSREKWGTILERHLFPAFGAVALEELRRAQVQAWRDELAAKIRAGEYSPNTVNGWLAVLRVIVTSFVNEHELARNPTAGIEDFDTSLHPTYTDEEPNALTVEEVRTFLVKMRELFPQHYAMTALGFATGLRPSSLRPLRRQGPQADLRWEDQVLLVRRSHTKRSEVMERTKTGLRQRISLPEEVIELLRWHVDQLPEEGPARDSELLFPSDEGGFRAASVLDKPFRAVARAAGIRKHITPRAMRRTFQDLARAAEVRDLVTRSISGHATETMQQHYSTVHPDEQRQGLGKVVSLAGFREALAGSPTTAEGVKGGVKKAQ